MNRQKIVFLIFILVAMIQLATPASMIAKREMTLRHGELFKFQAEPVDPYDAFRGRYVALRLTAADIELPVDFNTRHDRTVYVTFAEDEKGFSVLNHAYQDIPEGVPYIKTHVRWISRNQQGEMSIKVRLPFDRFYMEEEMAPAAESAFVRQSEEQSTATHITVRIRNGFGVIENLMFDGKPAAQYLKERSLQP